MICVCTHGNCVNVAFFTASQSIHQVWYQTLVTKALIVIDRVELMQSKLGMRNVAIEHNFCNDLINNRPH